MSTQQEPLSDEVTPLLQSPPQDPYLWYSPQRYLSPAIFVFPVALVARLSSSIPTSTTVYIVQQNVCRFYYRAHDPSRIPVEGPMPDELCDAPGVQQQFSAVVASIGVLTGIACVIGYSVLSHLSSTYGRKPAIILVLALGLSSNVSLLLSTWHRVGEIAEVVLLVLWILFDSFASLFLFVFLATTYVVDLVDAENRSRLLSSVYGWGLLGGALAFSLGGIVTTQTHDVLLVFRAATVLNVLNLLFTIFFLPESFSKERREELRRRAAEETQHRQGGFFQMIISKLGAAFSPVRMLKPVYNQNTGKRNWRLVWCALHIFIGEIGSSYTPTIAVIFLTVKFNYKPDETGFILAFISLAYAFTNTVIIPAIIPALRPLYNRKVLRESDTGDQNTVSNGTDRIDIHISVISWMAEMVGFLLFSYMTSTAGQYFAISIVALGAGKAPLFRSIVAASVEPLKQGETIAAIEMVASIGMLISPLYMGIVFSASITTMPSLVFYCNGLIILMGMSLLFFIKDSDRYQAPTADQ
ncbi:hypothetical protein D9757_012422 [Collybiopsis confluens]|uniref:Uncharacterized protein n=1 Tax=Collybiopsis confluens TaxID=2823264 RepID=A0A8H5CX09_9AGAR|nr:hypothetical protein D9757_012422 [Collybiopsis confluens]